MAEMPSNAIPYPNDPTENAIQIKSKLMEILNEDFILFMLKVLMFIIRKV
jgi:hypothetical protein